MKEFLKFIAAAALVCFFAAACDKEPKGPTDFSGGCEAVDLGLGVKWASWNVGASKAEERGSFFAWGETEEKTSYKWSKEGDYKWGVYDSSKPTRGMTKYTADSENGDKLKILLPEDDPATVNWGSKWRTPTLDEIEDLLKKCTWEQVWNDDKTRLKGYTVTNNGNSIFLPTTGYRYGTDIENDGTCGEYWSSEVNEPDPCLAYCLHTSPDLIDLEWGYTSRCYGRSVRAVTDF